MALATNAITTVARVQDYMGLTQPTGDAIDIFHDGTDSPTPSTTATVTVTDTTLTLIASGSSGTDSFTLANASYDTMSELVAAIVALASGWNATLLCPGTVSSTLLIPAPATNAFGQSNSIRLRFENTALLEELINRASDAIENWLHTIVKAQTGIREYVAGGRRTIGLRNWPVTAVTRVAHGPEIAFTIQNTDDTALRATVEVQDDKIVLTRIASAGTVDVATRAFADSATASAFASYISGLDNDWEVTVHNDCLMADLYRVAGREATSSALNIEYPATTADVEHVDEESALLHLVSPICERGQVQYDAGYSTIPDDIEHACIMLVQELWNARGRDGTLQSETIGSYSYTMSNVSTETVRSYMTPAIKALLQPYRRILA